MSESEKMECSNPCVCSEATVSEESVLTPDCMCPRNDYGVVIHEETCLLYKNEKFIYPHDPICECVSPTFKDGICLCCSCPADMCRCRKAGREALDSWRNTRNISAMPAVLESTHPLMMKFQETLKQFLIKENAIAEEKILNLREDLRLSQVAYDKDLESIYRSDHDTNAQRVLIGEYEETLAKRTMDREAAEKRARESNEAYKKAQDKLEENIIKEREYTAEMEALTALCTQLEAWRKETDSDWIISQRMSDKMKAEKRTLADEKRQLDILVFALNNEVWKLESKLELFKKQLEIKNREMEKNNEKVTAYVVELEELDLDKRRLMSLWNSVLTNIKQRDNVYNTVRDDYKIMQENYQTLMNSLDITKKILMEELHHSKTLAMNKDKLKYDINYATKMYDGEEKKKLNFEVQNNQLIESIQMIERDQEMIKSENQAMKGILKNTEKELAKSTEVKQNLENQILFNLKECLLNDKAAQSMVNGIRKMQDMSRKKEITLMSMENEYAQVMLRLEIQRNCQNKNKEILKKSEDTVSTMEKELQSLQDEQVNRMSTITRKQRLLDITTKKYQALKEIFDNKSAQERRIDDLEMNIKSMRERTEELQLKWLRLQGHVVKLAEQYHHFVTEIKLIDKQIQICEQKVMRTRADMQKVASDEKQMDRSLRSLQARLEVLERTRKEATERNDNAELTNLAITHEYTANLRDAEDEIMQLEEDIEGLDKAKMNLAQELDRVQREALIWQRKGILAVELKKNIKVAKSTQGEIGQLRAEIHRMEVRREQLRRTSEKLSEDLAVYVTRRENILDKSRAAAAVEKPHTSTTTSQIACRHKLRLAKADVARITKEIAEATAKMEQLQKDQKRVDRNIDKTTAIISLKETKIADLIKETRVTDRTKQWLLERVVRAQRCGAELSIAIKRQSFRCKKPREVIFEEHAKARALNDRLCYAVGVLLKEYPYLEDTLGSINNTLNIFSPTQTPQVSPKRVPALSAEEWGLRHFY